MTTDHSDVRTLPPETLACALLDALIHERRLTGQLGEALIAADVALDMGARAHGEVRAALDAWTIIQEIPAGETPAA